MPRGQYAVRVGPGPSPPPAACTVQADDKGITVSPASGPPLYIRYEQTARIEGADYRIVISLEDGSAVELSMLGQMYGDLLRQMRDARNEVWERGLFLNGVRRLDAFPCEVTLAGGPCQAEVRVYEDRLSVLPEGGDPFGNPYAFVEGASLDEASHAVDIKLSDGVDLLAGKLQRRTTEFSGLLNDLLIASRGRTAEALAAYLPDLPPVKLQALARLLPDGVAACRADVEAVEPSAWARLERFVTRTPDLAESYAFLARIASAPDVAIGLKQIRWSDDGQGPRTPEAFGKDAAAAHDEGIEDGGSETVERPVPERAGPEGKDPDEAEKGALVTWFLCPIPKGGAATADYIAQEITSEEGHATYFFRVDARAGWKAARDRINRAMLSLDFKRRPIFQSEDHLGRDPHAFAVKHLPHLRLLRESFAGRAIHTSIDSWKASVARILAGQLPA